ncbi:MAG TPA: DedA family protein [Polyangiaceae bacterium]|jgi:membrane protein DedA with SNARE-associated domain|nr:MAG: Inner membrane protein YqjA [Deltaproteobacteria bacterium ADurb.Bin207]HNS99013.1 DedA family protein [Polyangiaceae bacterium]HNZ23127.1 DedA family protein [Polyangiaceae bacterium]HOD22142.1 DedA family protein [Polyangiaceae bacterium]HOE49408.1 DedA family protein [Polyangiaceae bacterium]
MTETLISHIETLANYAPVWGFFLVFFFMTIESSFIPFPSEVVMIPAGFLAARGGLTFGSPVLDAIVAIAAGTIGSLAGAYINYYLAKWLGYPVLERYGKYFFLPKDKLERAQEIFRQYGPGATFVCRLLPAIRQLISIPAGLSNMKLGPFTLWTGLGAGFWVTILTVVGYTIGAHTASMSYADLVHKGKDQIGANLIYLIPTLLVGFALYVWISNRIMGKGKKVAVSG